MFFKIAITLSKYSGSICSSTSIQQTRSAGCGLSYSEKAGSNGKYSKSFKPILSNAFCKFLRKLEKRLMITYVFGAGEGN